jgi:hypothetical protein
MKIVDKVIEPKEQKEAIYTVSESITVDHPQDETKSLVLEKGDRFIVVQEKAEVKSNEKDLSEKEVTTVAGIERPAIIDEMKKQTEEKKEDDEKDNAAKKDVDKDDETEEDEEEEAGVEDKDEKKKKESILTIPEEMTFTHPEDDTKVVILEKGEKIKLVTE